MWIFLNDSFLSIVVAEPDSPGLPDAPGDWMCVRGRCPGDIEVVFPGVEVHEGLGSDYRYRAYLSREVVGEHLLAELERVTYGNFKNSVQESDRHDAYLRCWQAMLDLQRLTSRVKKR